VLRMRSGDLGDVRDIWIFRTGSGQDKRLAFQELLVEKEFNLALRLAFSVWEIPILGEAEGNHASQTANGAANEFGPR